MRVCEDRLLWRILELKREELAAGWRRMHDEDLHYLHFSPVSVMMIK
jgi:hypothetical protein